MAVLVWDQPGEKVYRTGVDRGVLYLHDGTAVVWNGLTGVEEDSNSELKSFYLDGVKFLESLSPSDYQGKLKAFTYPEEFDSVNGIANVAPGLAYYEQPPSSFNLSYRTRVGNDIEGSEFGYEIHILYNIIANPDAVNFSTIQDSGVTPIEFSWSLTGTPPKIEKLRPTVHVSIDSRTAPPQVLELLESQLYGTETSPARLPSIQEVSEWFGYLDALVIVDYGNGIWAAIDNSDQYITMIDDTTFQIDNADATYLDAVTYKVSSTNVDLGP